MMTILFQGQVPKFNAKIYTVTFLVTP